MLGAAIGAVAGLVAITPAAGFVTPGRSILIGLGAGVVCYGAAQLAAAGARRRRARRLRRPRRRRRLGRPRDRPLRHHGRQRGRRDGLLYGNPGQLVTQLIAVAAVGAYSAVMTGVILFLVNLVTPIRVAGDVEETGLDLAQHGEVAYQP